MANDKTSRFPQDRSRVAMGEDYEVDDWTGRFGVSRERFQQPVEAVGNSAEAIERHLNS